MSTLLKELSNQANSLTPAERAELAHNLIVSLEDTSEENDIGLAWEIEIEKRVKDIKSGKAKGRPAEEILSEIRAKYS